MTSPMLVWLIPAAMPDNSLPPAGNQPPWYPGFPAHPIPPNVWPNPPQGGAPPGFWGGTPPNYPAHPIAPGGPGGGQQPGHPSHPIYYPGYPGAPTHPIPPNIWPNPPENGGIVIPPPHVEHPIPPNVWPTPPGAPPGGETGSPEHPINLPPDYAGGNMPGFWALAFFPPSSWLWVWVPVTPEVTHYK